MSDRPQYAYVMDFAATSVVALSFLDAHAQGIALSLGGVWYGIQIWESKTLARTRDVLRKWLTDNGPV